ncbi:MAG: hypothetical protein GXP46_13040 [Deferribacteres bacterium]|nr:hypothetical protein [Deferribacteres bacterium]
MKMKTLKYRVKFITPAFLGNAEQKGQWRTPPFKALLRQWWRVVYAGEVNYNVNKLRAAEARLFGSVSDEGNGKSGKSRVRVRFERWEQGRLDNDQWPGGNLKRVTTTRDGKGQVRSDVYLGFGAVLPPSKKQNRKNIELQSPPAISPDESYTLWLQIVDDEDLQWLERTLELVNTFGTIGSRSRNAWGSLIIIPHEKAQYKPIFNPDILNNVCRPIEECFSETWPHAIGLDENRLPLIWTGKHDFPSWHSAMDFLAEVKVAIRRVAKGYTSNGVGGIHLLGYPAGNKWTVQQWEGNDNEKQKRFACPLRFKVVEIDKDRLHVVAVHLPHSLPYELIDRLTTNQKNWLTEKQQDIWKNIYQVLDRKIGRFG